MRTIGNVIFSEIERHINNQPPSVNEDSIHRIVDNYVERLNLTDEQAEALFKDLKNQAEEGLRDAWNETNKK
jgi:polyhydroxyalkanoate synthesis regulator phasin